VTRNDVTSPQVTGSYPEVTSFDCKLPGSNCRKPKHTYCVHFTSYKGVARKRRQSRTGNEVTSPQVTGSYREVTSFDRKSPGSGCRRPKTRIHCAFNILEGVARRRLSRGRKWRHVNSGYRKWPESDVIWPEVTWKRLYKTKNSDILYISFPTR